ncbi:MAG: hypothetical protein IJR28_05290 [Ottowia sp.]|nr:hypothetical protein [Ottowia sp.]
MEDMDLYGQKTYTHHYYTSLPATYAGNISIPIKTSKKARLQKRQGAPPQQRP